MTFRVVHQPTANHARSAFRVVEQTTGREVEWVNRYLDFDASAAWPASRSEAMHSSCCTLSVGGKVCITPMRLPKMRSPSPPCWSTCDFSPANNPSSPVPPSTNAWPLRIAPCAPLFPALPVRLLLGFR